MMMMFGDAGDMMAERDVSWVREMIAFMGDFNAELEKNGEFVYAEGLDAPSAAKVVGLADGQVVVTDGPYAEAKESLAGFWILDVADEARAVELAGRIAVWSQKVELRAVPDGPPEV
ncbi:MAG: YciI family protein [Actinoplanes sp.]